MTDEAVLEAIEAGSNYYPRSLDHPLEPDDGDQYGTIEIEVVDESFERRLEWTALANELPALAAQDRSVLIRVFLYERTQRDVAQELGISQNAGVEDSFEDAGASSPVPSSGTSELISPTKEAIE